MILTAKDSHLGSHLFGRICFPGLGHLPPSGVNNKKIFESTTLGNIESLPFFTVHLQPSYSLHMPKKPSKKKGTCSSSCYHFPTLMLLSDGLVFGEGYLRSLHELEEDQQGPSYVYYAKIYLIQIPQKNIAERKSSWVPGRGLFSKQRLKNTAFNTDIHLKPCRMSVHPSGIVPFHSGFPIKGEHEKNKLETTTYKTISSRQGSFSNPAKALILAFGNFPPQWIDSAIPFTQKVSSCKV